MAITLSTAARNAACNAVVDLVDVGAGSHGTLEILQTSTVLVSIDLDEPAFGSASTGVATAAGLPKSGVAIAAGTANAYKVKDEDGTVVWSGVATITGGGGDMILDNTNIAVGQTVTVTAWTHTQPA